MTRAWEALDESLGILRMHPSFKQIRSADDYADWIRFKMEVVVHFHKRFEKTPLVGGRIDVIVKKARRP